jgi:arsenical pump membrane protein
VPFASYLIAALALLGVVLRPWRSSELAWAAAGAAALVLSGLVPWANALSAAGKGTDVYLFLVGMMLLSAMAEHEGLFDYLAALCVARARGSPARLFFFVYAVGTLVTVFMSNDATAVVLTPAVLAVARKAKAKPLPYLLACALIANAASFVLPISNPANLIVFGDALPSLGSWMARFLWPSLLSIVATYLVLRLLSRRDLGASIAADVAVPLLSPSGKLAAAGIALAAAALLGASAFAVPLGLPTLLAAAVAFGAISIRKREAPWPVLRHISWSIVPLVAALFVIVEGLQRAGLQHLLTGLLRSAAAASTTGAALAAGSLVAFACNLMNNLPAGLIAGAVVAGAGVDRVVQSAVAIGIDLGPNLSVTGSLATILWLVALRKQGEHVSGWLFLKTGVVAMPVALAAALAALWLQALVTG